MSLDEMSTPYQPLDNESIRLLTIESYSDLTITCQLNAYPLASAPDYDALSYTWGEDKSEISILCNDVELKIRTNLFSALPFIDESRPAPQRPLWIDAICLNQEDHREKEQQVPLMGKIYENATRTLVWLGDAADDSDLALDNMHHLTQAMLAVQDPQQITHSLGHSEDIVRYGLPPVSDPIWKAMQRLQLRHWFFRLWTLQEVVLSKDPVFLCGTRSIPWDSMFALQQASMKASLISLAMPAEDLEVPTKNCHAFMYQIDGMRKRLRLIRNAMSLPLVIRFSMDRNYTEPVDRIWAVLGILNDSYRKQLEEAKIIDYSETTKWNYHKTYQAVMKVQIEHNPIAAMQLIAEGLPHTKNPLLPSWCPDWHGTKLGTPLSRMLGAAAGVPGGHVPGHVQGAAPVKLIRPVMSINEDSSLDVLGLLLDVVEKVSSDTGRFWTDYFNQNRKLDIDRLHTTYSWLNDCLDIVNGVPEHASDNLDVIGANPPTPADDNWAAFVIELYKKYERALAAMVSVLFPPYSKIMPNSGSLVMWANNRKFFRTKSGKFGLAHPDVEENDVVCALFGGYPLFILQPIQSPNPTIHKNDILRPCSAKAFQVVGDAYIPDWKGGQAFEGTSCEAMTTFKLV